MRARIGLPSAATVATLGKGLSRVIATSERLVGLDWLLLLAMVLLVGIQLRRIVRGLRTRLVISIVLWLRLLNLIRILRGIVHNSGIVRLIAILIVLLLIVVAVGIVVSIVLLIVVPTRIVAIPLVAIVLLIALLPIRLLLLIVILPALIRLLRLRLIILLRGRL